MLRLTERTNQLLIAHYPPAISCSLLLTPVRASSASLSSSACPLQDLQLEEAVDVVVSEWMGYMLLYEVRRGKEG